MFLLFFSCLQPVQTSVEPNAAQDACVESCLLQAQACSKERDCSGQCSNLVQQLTTGNCLDIAQEMWNCHQQIEWTCTQEEAEALSDQCSTQEVSAFYSGTGDAPSCSFRQNCSLTASDGITSELRFSASSSLEMDPPYTGNVTISKRDERIVDSVNGETVTDILFRCDFTVTDIE